MTEEDTFKKLKGLTWQEANEMFSVLYRQGMDSPTTYTLKDVEDYVDIGLRPYGWSIAAISQLRP
jgi:hypothetical protein